MTNARLLPALTVCIILLVVLIWIVNRGYGEVSPQTYEFSKALYGACQTRNPERLLKVEELLGGPMASGIGRKESRRQQLRSELLDDLEGLIVDTLIDDALCGMYDVRIGATG